MGKSEQSPRGLRRKAKGSASLSAGSRGMTSDPVASPSCAVDDLLCDSPAESPSCTPRSRGESNGRSSGSELTNGDAVGEELRPPREDGLDGEDGPAPAGDLGLPADLAALPHSDVTLLASDRSLDLSACHVLDQDALVLVVFVHNSSSSDIQQVLLELHSDELEVIC